VSNCKNNAEKYYLALKIYISTFWLSSHTS